jgi:hypothetical protein
LLDHICLLDRYWNLCDTHRPFHSDTYSLCCAYGKVQLPPLKAPPPFLQELLIANSSDARNLRDNIRAYNSSLAFASLGLTGEEFKFKTHGPYCFRINGQVYHNLGSVQPEHGQSPRFSQIYIYDQANELDNRLRWLDNLDRHVMSQLQDMMHTCNPYVAYYKQVNIKLLIVSIIIRIYAACGRTSLNSKHSK